MDEGRRGDRRFGNLAREIDLGTPAPNNAPPHLACGRAHRTMMPFAPPLLLHHGYELRIETYVVEGVLELALHQHEKFGLCFVGHVPETPEVAGWDGEDVARIERLAEFTLIPPVISNLPVMQMKVSVVRLWA
jgi:hypothetical protein